MKKIFAILCTLTLIVCMSATAFAAPSMPSTGTNKDITVTSPGSPSTDIPVYGYVGPDAEITDPNPTDPDGPPVINPTDTQISVSVPVKLMWAAFASGSGSIVSPTYTIENKGNFPVDVELTSFDQTSTSNAKDEDITLSLTALNAAATDVVGMTTPLSVGTLDATGGTAPSKTFTIGGTYSGAFGTVYQPTYEMVLTFSIH